MSGEGSIDGTGTDNSNDEEQSTNDESEEATSTSTKDIVSDDTPPLLEAIMNKVNDALSASGVGGPGF